MVPLRAAPLERGRAVIHPYRKRGEYCLGVRPHFVKHLLGYDTTPLPGFRLIDNRVSDDRAVCHCPCYGLPYLGGIDPVHSGSPLRQVKLSIGRVSCRNPSGHVEDQAMTSRPGRVYLEDDTVGVGKVVATAKRLDTLIDRSVRLPQTERAEWHARVFRRRQCVRRRERIGTR